MGATSLVWSKEGKGRLEGINYIASPNCDDRVEAEAITLLVIHSISLPPGEFGGVGIDALFTNTIDPDAHPYYREIAGLKVSAHFLIRRDGELVQFVPCDQRAWHAGVSSWCDRDRCNDYSIGVELEGCDEQSFETAQYERLNLLIAAVKQRYPIVAVVGHSDIAPCRKTDPGPCFDWSRINAR